MDNTQSPDDDFGIATATSAKVTIVNLMAQAVLIPVCLIPIFVIPESDDPTGKRFFLAGKLWILGTLVITAPIIVIAPFKALFGFLLGPEEYRSRWITLQFSAWTATILFMAAGVSFYHFYDHRTVGGAIVFTSIGTIFAGIGFYHVAMGCMPIRFFESDAMGKRILKFLGCKSSTSAPLRCWMAGLILTVLGIGMAAHPHFLFQH